jgi:DNA-3-methyladenine glycosylase I
MATTKQRCWWCGTDPLYVKYHDTEWGVPVLDDRALYEKLVLDGFQAGLSWITVLRKRDAFHQAFHNFDPLRIARYTDRDMARLLKNASIIRSRAKINGAITNARAYLQVMDQGPGSFRDLLWSHVDFKTRVNRFREAKDYPAATPESEAMARTLKRAGFKFCGPTICYAFMQAVGMTNDHLKSCFRHAPLVAGRVTAMPRLASKPTPRRAAAKPRAQSGSSC